MHADIKDLLPQLNIEDNYILSSHQLKLTKTQKNYMAVELTDKTGTLRANMWDVNPDIIGEYKDGEFVHVILTTGTYNGVLNATVQYIAPAQLSNAEKAELISVVDDIDEYKKKLGDYAGILKQPYQDMVLDMLKSSPAFTSLPAAKSNHHAAIGGLLQHTVEMLDIDKAMIDVFGRYQHIDADLLYTATILHDYGKLSEFVQGETGLITDYSVEGNLLGHITIGTAYAKELAEKHGLDEEHTILLMHMILSHHGSKQFDSPKEPMTVEAMILHSADVISAQMHEFHDTYENTQPGTMSDWVQSLQRRIYRPKD